MNLVQFCKKIRPKYASAKIEMKTEISSRGHDGVWNYVTCNGKKCRDKVCPTSRPVGTSCQSCPFSASGSHGFLWVKRLSNYCSLEFRGAYSASLEPVVWRLCTVLPYLRWILNYDGGNLRSSELRCNCTKRIKISIKFCGKKLQGANKRRTCLPWILLGQEIGNKANSKQSNVSIKKKKIREEDVCVGTVKPEKYFLFS